MIKTIKPEQVMQPLEFVLFLVVCSIGYILLKGCAIEVLILRGTEYDIVWEFVWGAVASIFSIMGVVYIRLILLTRERDMSMFACMYTLMLLAIAPFLYGVLKYSIPSPHIPTNLILPLVIIMVLVIIEIVYTVKQYKRNNISTERTAL